MKTKPFGQCGTCEFRNKCQVYTETNCKLIDCVYKDGFKRPKVIIKKK